MNEYLISLISVSAVVAVATVVAYDPRDKAFGVALAIILAFTSVAPILRAVLELGEEDIPLVLDEPFEDIPLADTEYARCAEEAFCLGILKMVCEEHSLKSADVGVYAFGFDVESMRASKIKIVLSGAAVTADARAIELSVERGGLGECEVILELSG